MVYTNHNQVEFTNLNQVSISSSKVEPDRELELNCRLAFKDRVDSDSLQASADYKQAPKLIAKVQRLSTRQDNRLADRQPNLYTMSKANPKPAERMQQAAASTAHRPKARPPNPVQSSILPSKA